MFPKGCISNTDGRKPKVCPPYKKQNIFVSASFALQMRLILILHITNLRSEVRPKVCLTVPTTCPSPNILLAHSAVFYYPCQGFKSLNLHHSELCPSIVVTPSHPQTCQTCWDIDQLVVTLRTNRTSHGTCSPSSLYVTASAQKTVCVTQNSLFCLSEPHATQTYLCIQLWNISSEFGSSKHYVSTMTRGQQIKFAKATLHQSLPRQISSFPKEQRAVLQLEQDQNFFKYQLH